MFPSHDHKGDMDAFTFSYKLEEDGKTIQKVRIYTAESIITFAKADASWVMESNEKHLFGKIPVVYVEQEEPEWEQVGPMIDNFENRISRLADTNDYFAEPLLKIFGKIARAPGKDEVGKMLEFEMTEGADGSSSHGDAEYATWDHTPESIKLEMQTSWDSIFTMTSTPDLSFNNLKGVGNVAAVAIELMFMDAFMARDEKMEIFDPALRRCISVIVAGIENYTMIKHKGSLSLDEIDVTFTNTLPNDLKNMVNPRS